MTFNESSTKAGWLLLRALQKSFKKRVFCDNTKFRDKIAYVGGPSCRRRPWPFGERRSRAPSTSAWSISNTRYYIQGIATFSYLVLVNYTEICFVCGCYNQFRTANIQTLAEWWYILWGWFYVFGKNDFMTLAVPMLSSWLLLKPPLKNILLQIQYGQFWH